jgi:hypothetical protein
MPLETAQVFEFKRNKGRPTLETKEARRSYLFPSQFCLAEGSLVGGRVAKAEAFDEVSNLHQRRAARASETIRTYWVMFWSGVII